jgi:hypothetical protein
LGGDWTIWNGENPGKSPKHAELGFFRSVRTLFSFSRLEMVKEKVGAFVV